MTAAPPFRYPGAKWQLSEWLITHFPPHVTYLEPYFGSGAVFFRKPPSPNEYLGDANHRIVRFFRVLREQPEALARAVALTPYAREEYHLAHQDSSDELEFARTFIIRHQMSIGGSTARGGSGWRHSGIKKGTSGAVNQWHNIPERLISCAQRLLSAHIECLEATDLISRFNAPDVLIYADPPYVDEVRARPGKRGRLYEQEMQDTAGHLALLAALRAHSGPVILSGYACDLYDTNLPGWTRIDRPASADGGAERTESIWVNEPVQRHLTARLAQRPLF